MKKKTKKPKKLFNTKKKECDFLWSTLIKARAGFVSELCGSEGSLQSHHIIGKRNLSLRYSILNGFCCLAGEHNYFLHGDNPNSVVMTMKEKKGSSIYTELEVVKNSKSVPMTAYYDYLLSELKPHRLAIKFWYEFQEYKTKAANDRYKHLLGLLEG